MKSWLAKRDEYDKEEGVERTNFEPEPPKGWDCTQEEWLNREQRRTKLAFLIVTPRGIPLFMKRKKGVGWDWEFPRGESAPDEPIADAIFRILDRALGLRVNLEKLSVVDRSHFQFFNTALLRVIIEDPNVQFVVLAGKLRFFTPSEVLKLSLYPDHLRFAEPVLRGLCQTTRAATG